LKQAHWSDISVYKTLSDMFAAAGVQIRQGLKADAGSEEYKKARAEYEELTTYKVPEGEAGRAWTGDMNQPLLEGIREKFAEMESKIPPMIEIEWEMRKDLNIVVGDMTTTTSLEFFQRDQMLVDSVEIAKESAKTLASVRSIYRNMRNSGAGGGGLGTGWHTNQTGELQSLINESKNKHKDAWARALNPNKKQHGGMINEPIWGIGASGQGYMFGEAGPERVIPTGASSRMGGGIGDVTINVNVDSINSDVDLEKIKPVVERALLEVHSRRGII